MKYYLFVVVFGFIVSSAHAVCPSTPCGTNGMCVDSQCHCNEGWSGDQCSIRTCLNPVDGTTCSEAGTCTSGICTCRSGFDGPTCRSVVALCGAATRQHVNATACTTFVAQVATPVRGVHLMECTACTKTCLSTSKALASNCDLLPIHSSSALCPSDTDGVSCSGKGQCGYTTAGVCACSTGYSGSSCSTAGSGACIPGRTGTGCYSATCTNPGFGVCSGHGTCGIAAVPKPPYVGFFTAWLNAVFIKTSDGRYLAATSPTTLLYQPTRASTGTEWSLGFITSSTEAVLYNINVGLFLDWTSTRGDVPILSPSSSPGTSLMWEWEDYGSVGSGNVQLKASASYAGVSGVYLTHPPLQSSIPPSTGYLITSSNFYVTADSSTTSASTTPDANSKWTIANPIAGFTTTIQNALFSVYLGVQATCNSDGFGAYTMSSPSLVVTSTNNGNCDCLFPNQVIICNDKFSWTTNTQSPPGVWVSSQLSITFGSAPMISVPGVLHINFKRTGIVDVVEFFGGTPTTDESFSLERTTCISCSDGYSGETCEKQPVGMAVCTSPSIGAVAGGYISDARYSSTVCSNSACTSNSTNGYCVCGTVWGGSSYSSCVPGSATTICSRPGCSDCPGGTSQLYVDGIQPIGGSPGQAPTFAGFGCCPTAYVDSNKSTRPVCGNRGVCTRDGTCTCNNGLGGTYCCPVDSNGIACGPHGTCTDSGTCSCLSGWSGTFCQTNTRCASQCTTNGGSCVTSDPLIRNLAYLHAGEPQSAIVAGLTAKVSTYVTVSGPFGSGSSSGNSGNNPSWNVATLLRRVFMAYDPTMVTASQHIPYWVNAAATLTISEDVYGSMLELWALTVFQNQWVTPDKTNSELIALINQAYLVIYPLSNSGETCALSPDYCTAIRVALQAATTREQFMRPLLAMLMEQIVRDGVTNIAAGSSYPTIVDPPTSGCVCPAGKSGANCEFSCPTGTNGQTCSGYIGAQQLGVCVDDTPSDVCVCPFSRTGIACELDLVGYCFVEGGNELCSGHGSCVSDNPSINSYKCECDSGWNSTYCELSKCSGTSTVCSNQGTCDDDAVCTCDPLILSQSGGANLPVGRLCEKNGAAACAIFWGGTTWRECSSIPQPTSMPARGSCNSTGTGCTCNVGFTGSKCEVSLCGTPACNGNQTCDTNAGLCVCLPRYTGVNCTQHLCGFGSPDSSGSNCICSDGYRLDGSGVCTIIQCPLVQVLDTGSVRCPVGIPICSASVIATLSIADAYTYSHTQSCCYDQCVKNTGATNCAFNSTGSRECACASGYNQVAGVCMSRCNGQGAAPCGTCSTAWPLYPTLDTVHEYLTLASCARVTCLHGGVVASSGQSCVCTGTGYTGSTCQIAILPSSSASTLIPSSSASPSPPSSSASTPLPSSSAPNLPSSSAPPRSSSSSSFVSSSTGTTVLPSSSGSGGGSNSSSGDAGANNNNSSSSSSTAGEIASEAETSSSSGLSEGAVIGIAVAGATVGVGAIAGIMFWLFQKPVLAFVPLVGGQHRFH
jgi:hypothetical protein